MNLIFIVLTAVVVTTIFGLGLLFFLKNKSNRINQSFGLFAFLTALWLLLDFSVYQTSLAEYQLLLNKLVGAVVCYMVFFLFYFITIFPKEIFRISTFWKWLIFLITVTLSLITIFTNLVAKDVRIETWGSDLIQGPLYIVFVFFYSISSDSIFNSLANKMEKISRHRKTPSPICSLRNIDNSCHEACF